MSVFKYEMGEEVWVLSNLSSRMAYKCDKCNEDRLTRSWENEFFYVYKTEIVGLLAHEETEWDDREVSYFVSPDLSCKWASPVDEKWIFRKKSKAIKKGRGYRVKAPKSVDQTEFKRVRI